MSNQVLKRSPKTTVPPLTNKKLLKFRIRFWFRYRYGLSFGFGFGIGSDPTEISVFWFRFKLRFRSITSMNLSLPQNPISSSNNDRIDFFQGNQTTRVHSDVIYLLKHEIVEKKTYISTNVDQPNQSLPNLT